MMENHASARRLRRLATDPVARQLRERRRAKVHAAYEEAARDPEFVVEMREIADAFDAALLDGLSERDAQH